MCATSAAGRQGRIASKRCWDPARRSRRAASGSDCCKASWIGSASRRFGSMHRSLVVQILITHGSLARTRVLRFNRLQLLCALALLALALMLTSGAIYHYILLTAARQGWPIVSPLVRLVVRDDIAQRDRVMRENLDAMATRLGEMQAKLVRLEAISERVSGMAGVKPEDKPQLPPASTHARGGQGGPFVAVSRVSMDQLRGMADQLDDAA